MQTGKGTYHALILIQHLIVLTQTDQEYKRGHVLETVDPLPTFTPLATDIEQLIRQIANLERRFRDSCRLHTTPEDVLVGWEIRRGGHMVDRVEVVHGGVVELELARAVHGFLHSRVPP